MRRPSTIAALTLLLAAPLSAQQLNTAPAWDGSSSIAPFGNPQTATYGQTFFALNTSLDGFSFWLRDASGANVGDTFTAHVAAWDGNSTVGPILFSSGPIAGQAGTGMNEYHVNTGGLTLDMSTQYVAFFHAGSTAGTWSMGLVADPNSYANGAFVFYNNTPGAAGLAELTNTWDNFLGNFGDAAFVADFSEAGSGQEVVPEPATMSLMALGLAGMAGARRRRKTA